MTPERIDAEIANSGASSENYFAVLLPVLKTSFEKAVPILVQGDRYRHVANDNWNIEAFAYLLGSFNWGNKKIPVQYELKRFNDGNQSRVYIVATTKEDAFVAARDFLLEEPKTAPASFDTSITELVKKVNQEGEKILANIPVGFLSDVQMVIKRNAQKK